MFTIKQNHAISAIILLASVSFTADAEELSVCVNKKTSVTRFALKCKATEYPFKVGTLLIGSSDLQDEVTQLREDVNQLNGLPAADPVGTFENDSIKVTVLGLAKRVSSITGKVAIGATFRIKNKTTASLLLGWDRVAGFNVLDNHGISASCAGITGSVCSLTGIKALNGDAATFSLASFSVVAPSSIVAFGLLTNELDADVSAQLGNRFNPAFNLLLVNDVAKKVEVIAINFSEIAATP